MLPTTLVVKSKLSWKKKVLIVLAIILGLMSFLPLWDDPYYHKEKVNFWTFAAREIDELKHGER